MNRQSERAKGLYVVMLEWFSDQECLSEVFPL